MSGAAKMSTESKQNPYEHDGGSQLSCQTGYHVGPTDGLSLAACPPRELT